MRWEMLKVYELHSVPGQIGTVKNVEKVTVSAPPALTLRHFGEYLQFSSFSNGHSLKDIKNTGNECKNYRHNTC
jgi:hypothetical protein